MHNNEIEMIVHPDRQNATPAMPPVQTPLDVEVDWEIIKVLPQAFCIESEDSAAWVVRKIAQARQYGERVKLWADREMRRAEREEQTLMYMFGRQLEDWARAELQRRSGKRKSVPLPAGTLGFRTTPQKLVIDDEKLVMAWAKEHCPAAVVTSERLVKTPLDELMKETGEMPDAGVHVQPEFEQFYVR